MMRMRVAKIAALITVLSLGLLPTMVPALELGDKSPKLLGRTLDGDLFRLKSAAGAKVVNFFWVQCKPCRKELPELQHLEQEYPAVKFIAVHVEEEEQETVQAFIDSLDGAPKTVVLSSPMVKEGFGLKVLPYTVLIGADNKVKAMIHGYTEAGMNELKARLEEL